MSRRSKPAAWADLEARHRALSGTTLRTLFQRDPARADRLVATCGDLELDYSRNLLDDEALASLLALARGRAVEQRIGALFAGEAVNVTERRPALHMALRLPSGGPVTAGDATVRAAVLEVRRRMRHFCERAHNGQWRGFSGEPVTDVVQIGIGGSDLGPRMALEALAPDRHPSAPRVHFVANVDGAELQGVLAGLRPQTTALIVVSKSFTTQETRINYRSARAWLAAAAGGDEALAGLCLAVTGATDVARAAGFQEECIFPVQDWVGGRCSVWSAAGIGLALGIGMDRFEEVLAGAHAMDRHFRETPLPDNVPVLLALLGVWNCNLRGAASYLVQPYAQGLARLPAYLQQLEMESNGKQVTLAGEAVARDTAPVVWGEPGTNAQHAYFQLLHQGTRTVAVDFILPLAARHALGRHQDMLVANCLAQAAALAFGRDEDETRALLLAEGRDPDRDGWLVAHRRCPGNRPSNLITIPRLDPWHLGMLIALYEHKVFVQSVLWGINAFDQWGVELGKGLANSVLDAITAAAPEPSAFDRATLRAIGRYRSVRATTPAP